MFRGQLNGVAGNIAELGSTFLYIMAVADSIRSLIVALASFGVISFVSGILPGDYQKGVFYIGVAFSAGMALASVYAIIVAYVSRKHYRDIREGTLTEEKRREMLKIILPDFLLSLVFQAYLSLIGLALVILALLIYEPVDTL